MENRLAVEAPHPVHSFMEEHKIILESLQELSVLASDLLQAESLKAWGENLDRLKGVAHNLVEAESHHQIAQQTLTSQEWQEVKKECDKIGYCCFTPQDRG